MKSEVRDSNNWTTFFTFNGIIVQLLIMFYVGLLLNCSPAFWQGFSEGVASTTSSSNSNFYFLDGNAVIISSDGQFLGKITSNQFDSQSIINEYGSYGSKYSSTSIYNDYGTYGGQYSSKSPFNTYASDPPIVYIDDEFKGYLTTNTYKYPRIDPYALIGYLKSK